MRRAALPIALLALAAPAVDPVAASAADVHVVQPGETLWQIALNLSGDPARWPELYRANRDQIKDPSMLYPGQRLAIPDFGAEPDAAGERDDDAAAPPGASGGAPE